jgi:hypothetical protein
MAHWAEYKCPDHSDPYECPDHITSFSKKSSSYGIIVHDGGSSSISIGFCPWCGAQLKRAKR